MRSGRLGRWSAALLLALGAATGCSSGAPAAPPGTAPSSSLTPASTAAPSPAGFTNPVYDGDFPDPMVVRAGSSYVAVATNSSGSHVQTLTSRDLVTWEQGDDALPRLPSWSATGKVWAPEVARRADGRYLLYYTTRSPNPDVQCVSVAVGSAPQGPYTDRSRKPLVCQPKLGGSIDASPFTAADGRRYLYWKNDGNALGLDSWIWGQRLAADGTTLTGRPQRLFRQDKAWEGALVEAPFGWQQGGRFHLFYSGGAYDNDSYAVGHATARSPLGPFTKDADPVLSTDDVAAGPGHCALIVKDGRTWMVYHAWSPDAIGQPDPGRQLWLSEVRFAADGHVTVVPPTADYPTAP